MAPKSRKQGTRNSPGMKDDRGEKEDRELDRRDIEAEFDVRRGPAILVDRIPIPLGSIFPFAGVFNADLGPNWQLCAGQSVRISDFKDLHDVIGDAWGKGSDPPRTFNLPDLRGRFLRGIANGLDLDPDRDDRTGNNGGNTGDKVGSLQGFATALPKKRRFVSGDESNRHNHGVQHDAQRQGGPNTFDADDERGVNGSVNISILNNTQGHTHDIVLGGDDETRPVNAYVNWIIRVK